MIRFGRSNGGTEPVRVGIGWDSLPLTTVCKPGETKVFHVSPRYMATRLQKILLTGNYLELRVLSLQVGHTDFIKREGPAWILNHTQLGLYVSAREPVTLALYNPAQHPRQITAAFDFEIIKR